MKIYFVTHSETTDNRDGLASGWKDVGLSKLGIKQAKEMSERLKDISFDLICCSDLKRAMNTVNLAFANQYPVISDMRLRELNYGDLNGKPSDEVGWQKKECIRTPFPNGESYEQAMVRVQEFYNDLKDEYPDKTILIVGHRATQYGLDTMVLGKSLEECVTAPFEWQPYWEYNLK